MTDYVIHRKQDILHIHSSVVYGRETLNDLAGPGKCRDLWKNIYQICYWSKRFPL